MSCFGTPIFRGAIVACAAAFVTLSSAPVDAQNVTLDFNTLTETVEGAGTRFVDNCYQENGFVLTAVGLPCAGSASENAFVAHGPNSPLFGGNDSPALVLNSPDASEIDLMRNSGGQFSLVSIAMSGFFGADMTSVLFTGFGIGGAVMQTFDVGAAMQTYTFGNDFSLLTSVRLTAFNEFDEPLVNIDDIMLSVMPSVTVPEPAPLALMMAGMLGLLLVTRSRGRA